MRKITVQQIIMLHEILVKYSGGATGITVKVDVVGGVL